MKIGIITFTGTANYGAALQIHALQKVIAESGADCETISYDNPYITREHTASGLFCKKGIKNKIRALMLYFPYKKRMQRFHEFEEKYCRFSEMIYNKNNISDANNIYDCFVTGSDQVWNTEITHDDSVYFLGFASENKRLCSYAASSGTDSINSDDSYMKILERYSLISVREKPLENFLRNNGGFDASKIRTDIDPTLLLDNSYWKKFIGASPCGQDYIFLYLYKQTPDTLAFIDNLSKKYNCRVFCCTKSASSEHGYKKLMSLSPEEFLNYIYHAKFVITGSFHAVCFSIQFHKELYMTVSPIVNRTARLRNLAEQLGLENRLISVKPTEQPPADYSAADKKLAVMRQESLEAIKIICGDKEGRAAY